MHDAYYLRSRRQLGNPRERPTRKQEALAQSDSSEHDPHSNKTVIVCARGCWIVMGYTGLAYLDGKPTDQLIAEAVSGYDDLSDSAFSFWRPPPELHYREIRNRVEQKLRSAYSRLPKTVAAQYATIILGVGIQRKDGRVHKVMFRTTVQGDSATSIELGPEVDAFKAFRINAVGVVYRPIIDRARDRIQQLEAARNTR